MHNYLINNSLAKRRRIEEGYQSDGEDSEEYGEEEEEEKQEKEEDKVVEEKNERIGGEYVDMGNESKGQKEKEEDNIIETVTAEEFQLALNQIRKRKKDQQVKISTYVLVS